MGQRRAVYNGYEEKYITGAELKQLFESCYFTGKRHHSTVLGISIPDYLDIMGVDPNKTYRVFLNEFFCKIMKEDTDGEICFFGYVATEGIKTSIDLLDIEVPKVCSVCGAPMLFKTGKYGEFLGCSSYPKCKETKKIPIVGHCL